MEFFSVNNVHLYIAIILAVINGILMCFASYKFFQMIQLSGYKLKGYFIWLKDTKGKYIGRMLMLTLLSTFCVLVTNSLFDVYHSKALYSYIGLIFYFYFTIVFIVNLYSAPKKIPLKNTTRMTRLNVAMFLVTGAISFFIIALSTEFLPFIRYGALCFVPIAVPIIVPFVHLLLIPLEKLITHTYVARAKKKLNENKKLIKIGITGSFGKTSTKYILNTILSQKYKVCMSPHSFNTLPGLTKVINDYLKDDDEILIAEMGAKNVGDIKELCSLINPKYGIITGIGIQHLLYFKTEENVYKTKYELIESLPKEDGFAIFNGENEGSKKLYEKCNLEKKLATLSGDIGAEDIDYNENGTVFTLKIGKEKFKTHTKLLGIHNVENIIMCVEMAIKLGLTNKQIVKGIETLEAVPHRLEPIKNDNYLILDDAYNSNVEGSDVALNVLSKMPGRKIVVTPGLVELGKEEYNKNKEFGEKIAKVADFVIIVNKVNFNAIKEGLESQNFGDKIFQAESLQKASLMIQENVEEGDTILFENDLPDNYI